MRKIIIFATLITIFLFACADSGKERIVYKTVPNAEDGSNVIDPNSIPETGVTVNFKVGNLAGQDAKLKIFKLSEDASNYYLDQEKQIVLEDGPMFLQLIAGNYYISIESIDKPGACRFNGYQFFEVIYGQRTTVGVTIFSKLCINDSVAIVTEVIQVPTYQMSLAVDSPSGMQPVGDIDVLSFYVWHDWPEALVVDYLNFGIYKNDTVEIQSCSLRSADGTFQVAGLIPTTSNEYNYIETQADLLIPAYTTQKYILRCQITAAVSNDYLQLAIQGFAGDPNVEFYYVEGLPGGNTLIF